jgi:hypothetical protein
MISPSTRRVQNAASRALSRSALPSELAQSSRQLRSLTTFSMARSSSADGGFATSSSRTPMVAVSCPVSRRLRAVTLCR